MRNNKFCVSIFCGFTVAELCRLGRENGFDGFFSDETEAIQGEKICQNRRMADQYSLYYETSHSTIPGCTGLWKDMSSAAAYETVLQTCVDNCQANRIPILVVHVQTDGKESRTEPGMRSLENIIRYADERQVKIAFENINNPPLLYHVMETFRQSNVGFCYDCGHELCHTPGEDFLARLGDRLLCTHIHDNNGNMDAHWLPYTGKVDFSRMAAHMKEVQYQGCLSLELAYHGNDAGKKAFLQEALAGLERLHGEIWT